MSYFDQVYRQLFGKQSKGPKILVHEVIDRSEKYLNAYNERIQSDDFKELAKDVYSSYVLKQQAIDKLPSIHLLISQHANGFAISYHEDIGTIDFKFLFDWLSERTRSLDYKLANSDLTVVEKNGVIESKEKHYLKPRVGNEKIIDQQYGNILIEYIAIDDVPSYVKYTANIYSDRKYQKALEFDKLAEYLFQDLINE
tara:strand:+ start:3697 stop:4290 length:594 start_codon:yes stop_codon:yes gene_type:complete